MEADKTLPWQNFLIVQIVTLVRIPLAILFGLLLAIATPSLLVVLVCLVLLFFGEITDFLDGYLARRLGVVSEWGAMLDPYADSMARLLVYWSLANVNMAFWMVPLVMALRDISVAYCRIILSRAGKTVSAKWSGKIKAVVQGVGAFLLVGVPIYGGLTGNVWPMPVFSWIVVVVTAASAVEYVAAAYAAIRQEGLNPDSR